MVACVNSRRPYSPCQQFIWLQQRWKQSSPRTHGRWGQQLGTSLHRSNETAVSRAWRGVLLFVQGLDAIDTV